MATSTTEAEYIAAAQASRELIWLKLLIKDMVQTYGPVRMLCDNQSALKLMDNPAGSARSKHIDVAHHVVRDRAARVDLTLEYISTSDTVADGHTKALPLVLLSACREGMGLHDVGADGGLRRIVPRVSDSHPSPTESCPRCDVTPPPGSGPCKCTTD